MNYAKSECCGADCYAFETNEFQPCWGTVTVVDEEYDEYDSYWIHACEGHLDTYPSGPYRPPPAAVAQG